MLKDLEERKLMRAIASVKWWAWLIIGIILIGLLLWGLLANDTIVPDTKKYYEENSKKESTQIIPSNIQEIQGDSSVGY